MSGLRPHQILGIDMCSESIKLGKRRPLLAAPTSYGKTYVAAEIARRAQAKGKRVIFIADRIKLINQTISHFGGIDFGVMQGSHELTNPNAPVQIASIQTLSSRKRMPEFDLAIVDECHLVYKYAAKMMAAYDRVPFIGLSATPYSKGLGEYYDNLLVPITPRELEAQGYLCPVTYYGGAHIDTSKIKSKALRTGGSEWDEKALSDEMEKDKSLIGNITRNWYEKAESKMTIAFSPSINASKWLVDEYNGNGVEAAHIDGYTSPEEREELYQAHRDGEITMLSCSQLLNTGHDEPGVECLIDCFPVKSVIAYVQRVGRIKRIKEGKDGAIYLDHADNFSRFGFAEDIVPESLDDGTKRFNEKNQIKKEKKESKKKDCPQCHQKMVGIKCMACGYEVPMHEQMQDDNSDLVELKTAPEKRNRLESKEDKALFLGELQRYAISKGKNPGSAAHNYKARYGVWPNKITPYIVSEIRPETMSFIKSRNIRYAKASG